VGCNEQINALSQCWGNRDTIQLSQGLSMMFLTDDLFDKITELANLKYCQTYDGFVYLTSSIMAVLEEHSHQGKLAYFETDYFGGKGSQAAILYESGRQKFPAIITNDMVKSSSNVWAVNTILKEFGVYRQDGKDEFDSIGLGDFRRME